MYTFERRHLVKLGGTLDPAASRTVDVPLTVDDAVQYLACWVYTPGKILLGGGSVQLFRNGELTGAATAFAGRTVVMPVNLLTVGTDVEMQLLHPQTANAKPLSSIWRYDATAAAMVEDTDVRKFAPPPQITIAARVINTDAVKKDLVVLWTGLIWRNA